MFDIGFWELSLIGIVGLLVIGPERMPAVARTVGKWVGRANRFISNVKDDINKELKDEDLKHILEEQRALADEYKKAANSFNDSETANVTSKSFFGSSFDSNNVITSLYCCFENLLTCNPFSKILDSIETLFAYGNIFSTIGAFSFNFCNSLSIFFHELK